MASETREAFTNLIAALLGISTFKPPGQYGGPELGDEEVNRARESLGGSLEAIPRVRLRWYPPDIERAQRQADNGDLTMVGQLCQSMRIDGVVRGLLDARTSVCNFPRRFYGSSEVIDVLRARTNSDRDVYDELIPATEARLMVGDGEICGVAVGEMVPVKGRNFPVLVRRFPQNLWYLWSRDQWYYRSIVGLLPITPGYPDANGNSWVLHFPGGRLAPWNSGLWNTLGRSYINKTQTIFARQAYEMKHSHPARVAFAALGATEEERRGILNGIIKWALNAAFALPVGWDLKLVESNGQGIKVYNDSIKTYNEEMATALCGSSVMLQGTVGFSNMSPFEVVARDLMTSTAGGWDHTVNTQILPAFIASRWGTDAVLNATTVETDTAEPQDRNAEAQTLASLGAAISSLVAALNAAQIAAGVAEPITVDVDELLARYGVPTRPGVIVATPANDGPGGGSGTLPPAPPSEPAARELPPASEEAA